jgi:lipopolysaccharide transport system ATP-binding protein
MKNHEWQIGVIGTFDVENYGDLLFPLVAEAELSARLGQIKLHCFSYHTKTPSRWPYAVTSVTELPQMIDHLDAMLIGGGFLIRFDKEVAPGYAPPRPTIHHPTGYWLTPALLALQHNVPLIWNAPGMHCNQIPVWANPLMELAFTHSSYIAVRDKLSQAALSPFNGKKEIAVVPDTAFGITRLFNEQLSVEFHHLRQQSGLTGPYIIIQSALGLDNFLSFIKKHRQRLQNFQFLALPIGPVLHDHVAILGADLPGLVRLMDWPHPLLLAKLISQAEAVVGHSYHLAITALASGVPAFTLQDLSTGKYSALSGFGTIFQLAKLGEPDIDWFLARIGKTAPSIAACATLEQLAQHWDSVTAAIRAGSTTTGVWLNRFWQTLPRLLEEGSTLHNATIAALLSECTEKQQRIDDLSRQLAQARGEIDSHHNGMAHLQDRSRVKR